MVVPVVVLGVVAVVVLAEVVVAGVVVDVVGPVEQHECKSDHQTEYFHVHQFRRSSGERQGVSISQSSVSFSQDANLVSKAKNVVSSASCLPLEHCRPEERRELNTWTGRPSSASVVVGLWCSTRR